MNGTPASPTDCAELTTPSRTTIAVSANLASPGKASFRLSPFFGLTLARLNKVRECRMVVVVQEKHISENIQEDLNTRIWTVTLLKKEMHNG
jgi:hypothetical protein